MLCSIASNILYSKAGADLGGGGELVHNLPSPLPPKLHSPITPQPHDIV